MRALFVVWMATALGCSTQCRPGTVLLKLQFDSITSHADTLDIDVDIDTRGAKHYQLTRAPGSSSSLELRFSGPYPANQSISFTVIASENGTAIGGAILAELVDPGCSIIEMSIPAVSFDGGLDATGLQDLSRVGDSGQFGDGAIDGPVGDAACTVCMNNDGCCPASCNNNNDNDCAPRCGNGAIETGEICDDGNLNNGDACDPTCQFTNTMTTLSGFAGGTSWADGVTGQYVRFDLPYGITNDGTSVYVVDGVDKTLRKIDPLTGGTTTIVGVSGDGNSVDGTGTVARLTAPTWITYLGGTLYITQPTVIRTVALPSLSVNTVPGTTIALSNPSGLGNDGTNIVVLDDTGLRKWNPSGTSVSTVYSKATLAAQNCGICTGVDFNNTFDATHYYLGCANCIVQADVTGVAALSIYAGKASTGGCADNNGNKLMATFSSISAIRVDPTEVIVSDCNKIRQADASGVVTIAGPGTGLSTSGWADNGNPSNALFFAPLGLTRIGSNLYISDSDNAAVRVDGSTGVSTFAGRPPSAMVWGADAGSSRYTGLAGMTSDGSNAYTLHSTGFGGDLTKVSFANGGATKLVTVNGFPLSTLFFKGFVYTSNKRGTISQVATDGSTDVVYAGTDGTTSPPSDNTPPSPLTTAVLRADALATDGTNIYFVDGVSNLIRMVDVANAKTATIAGTLVSGMPTMDATDGTGSGAHFASPQGLACDGQYLYTIDAAGALIRRIEISTGKVLTLAGQVNVTQAQDGIGTAATFAGASALTTDGRSLFITDPGPGHLNVLGTTGPAIRQLDLKTLAVTTMLGQRDIWTLKNGVGTGAQIDEPTFITFEPTTHALYFVDTNEHVIQKVK